MRGTYDIYAKICIDNYAKRTKDVTSINRVVERLDQGVSIYKMYTDPLYLYVSVQLRLLRKYWRVHQTVCRLPIGKLLDPAHIYFMTLI